RDPQRTLSPSRFGYPHPTEGSRTVLTRPHFLPQFPQPRLPSLLLDLLEGDSIHARRSRLAAASLIRFAENILPPDLVPETVKTIAGFCLGFRQQRTLQLPNLSGFRRAKFVDIAINLHGSCHFVSLVWKSGSLPSTRITGLRGYYAPIRHLPEPPASLAGQTLR